MWRFGADDGTAEGTGQRGLALGGGSCLKGQARLGRRGWCFQRVASGLKGLAVGLKVGPWEAGSCSNVAPISQLTTVALGRGAGWAQTPRGVGCLDFGAKLSAKAHWSGTSAAPCGLSPSAPSLSEHSAAPLVISCHSAVSSISVPPGERTEHMEGLDGVDDGGEGRAGRGGGGFGSWRLGMALGGLGLSGCAPGGCTGCCWGEGLKVKSGCVGMLRVQLMSG